VAGGLREPLQAPEHPAAAGPLARRDVTSGGPRAAIEPPLRYDIPIEEDPIRLVLERRVPWVVHDETFSQQSFGAGPWPDQGWKLHVSATPLSAVDVLERALDVLLAEGARFKVVTTVGVLGSMNFGLFGVSQIGKFITVYPSDDAHAVRLAVALDAATAGRRGPRVPTDRPLGPGSLVHYRYGSMVRRSHGGGHEEQGGNDLLDPAGRLIDDVRVGFYWPPPPEIVDPFEAAGVRVPPPARGRFLNGRYLVSDALGQSPRGAVFRALDVMAEPPRMCLLKEAWHDVGVDPYGRDACDWAANEEHILSRYAGEPVLPRFYDSFEVDGDRYIVIEFIEGSSFDKVLVDDLDFQHGVDPVDVVALGLASGDALARLHELGLVFRDFKPANLIRTRKGGYRLIDFGIVHEYLEDSSPPLATGTPPFYSQEQYDGQPPCPAHDVFAWGAVLYHLAAGEASFEDMLEGRDVQQPFPRRPLAELRPAFPAALAGVIDRAVAWEPADRYHTMREARDALAEAAQRLDDGPGHAPASVAELDVERPVTSGLTSAEALGLAREVGDALCDAAEERDGGLCWKRQFEWTEQTTYSPDLYGGAAGIGLFLAALAHETGDGRYADTARGAARWVAGPAWGHGRGQQGLHDGEAGVAYFLLRLAELLDAPGYVAAAELRLRRLRGAPARTVDLMYGTAGTLLGSLAVHAVTRDDELLSDARTAGDQLVASALGAPGGGAGCYWEVPWAAPGGAVTPSLGLLHGGAGIGLALALIGLVTADERYLQMATGAADLLLAHAETTEDGALSWPRHLGDAKPGLQAHCHGAGGIGQFFLALDRVVPDPRYRQAAAGAARTVAAARANEPRSGICHGLSGIGHFMLDCYQAFDDPQWLAFAGECGADLHRFRHPERPGVYVMEDDSAVSPDLFLGYAGAGSLLLRLAKPADAPDLVLGQLNNSLMQGKSNVRGDPQKVPERLN
jgi:hypothetical protein